MNGSLRASGRALFLILGLGLALSPAMVPGGAQAQTPDTLTQAQDGSLRVLRDRIESRYQVVPVQNGILLLPQYGIPAVQSIQLTDGEIAINGEGVTGAELRTLVPEDADAILRLSYLETTERRILFGIGGAPAPADTAAAVEDTTAQAEEEEDYERPERAVRSTGDRVRVGASIHIDSDELVDGDVVAVFGAVRIDGTVTGDVVAVGGSVRLGPDALIEGDVTAVGGTIDRTQGARVMGSIDEVAWGGPDIRVRGPQFHAPFLEGIGGLVGTVVGIILLGAFASLAYLLARRPVERMAYRVATSPWKSALVGLVAQILFFPALVLLVILLAVSIIGIPLLLVIPFALVALVLGVLVGFTAVARQLGGAAEQRFGWQHDSPFIAVLIGVGIIMLLSFFASALGVAGGPLKVFAVILGILGFVVQYAAWTVGFGALLLTRFGTRYGWGDAGTETPTPPAPGAPEAPGLPPGTAAPPEGTAGV
ncbi:MAG TPA: polymer-forming cytoskeletal protein [Gemmatimonadota bacterium]|nr:polymer-forming cytoskeletal protein [Gemmatimonadota bacterium]